MADDDRDLLSEWIAPGNDRAWEAVEKIKAEAWAEGYDAGDSDARAVQKTWPVPTVNPYR